MGWPVRMFGGSGDYNSAATCAAYAERLGSADADVDQTVYPGAQHVLNGVTGPSQPVVAKDVQTVRACTIREFADGYLVEGASAKPFTDADPCVQRDSHIGSDAAARAATLSSVADALDAAFWSP